MMAEGGSSIVFDSSDPTIKNDLNVIIHQYLVEQQFISAANAIQSELSQRNIDAITKRSQIVLMRNLLCRGEWDEAHQLLAKLVPRSDIRRFLYHFNKLEFLEFIETSQHLQALAFLQTHLKPFEDIACNQRKGEFKELCYLLSCKSLADSEQYRPFAHFVKQREIEVEEICESISTYLQLTQSRNGLAAPILSGTVEKDSVKLEMTDEGQQVWASDGVAPVKGRLISLLQQAFAYQILMRSNTPLDEQPGPNLVNDSDSRSSPAVSSEVTSPRPITVASTIQHVVRNKSNSDGSSVAVHRLINDYSVAVVPSRPLAVLIMQPITSDQSQVENSSQRRSLGDIRCLAITGATASTTLLTSSSRLSGSSSFENADPDLEGVGSFTVAAGTDRGSLLLWQLSSKHRGKQKNESGVTDTAPEVLNSGENSHMFDISHDRFKNSLLVPTAVLQLRKGDNVRVRRTYKGDDDDDSGLFPPKIRAVAVSSCTGSLAWSHSSSSVSSSVLVAAGLSDGTIALVCAGYQTNDGDHSDISSSRYVSGSTRYRSGDSSSNIQNSSNSNNDSKQKGRSRSRSRAEDLSFCPRHPMAFSQKRSYLETHEGDVFSVSFHPEGRHLASGGQDRILAVHDVVAASCIKQFEGHNAAITHVTYNRLGNLVVSSSKDGTIKIWDTLSGLCVRTISPTLLARSGSGFAGNSQSYSKISNLLPENRPSSSSLSSSSASYFLSSSTSSSTLDQTGGEILSTVVSDDGHYLLVSPRLSATRLLDLRMGTVRSLFSDSSHCSGNSNGADRSLDRRGKDIDRKGIQLGNLNGEGDSIALDQPLYQQQRSHLPRRASNVLFQQAAFCCGGSVVALGRGGDGRGPGPVSAVKLWSASTGQLMKTMAICCNTRPAPSVSSSSVTDRRGSAGSMQLKKISDLSSVEIVNDGDISSDTDRFEGNIRQSERYPVKGSVKTEKEEEGMLERKDGESNINRSLLAECNKFNRSFNFMSDSNSNSNSSYSFSRSYLDLLVNSPVFATVYEPQSGVLAAASAAGISLWI